MDRTDQHGLPYVAADQAQKHVTVNEGLRMLDALVGASARSASVGAQPAAPAPGEAYILPDGAAGAAWDGFAVGTYAVFQDGAWAAFAPRAGLSVFVEDEGASRVWNGAAWAVQAGGVQDAAARFGVNAKADATNKLVVKSDAVLHSHDDVTPGSGDARHVLNKSAPGNTASFLFQTGYGGRAEIGLTGSDDFAFKVSPDGVTWYTALTIDRNTGAVTLPNTDGQAAPADPVHEVWVVIGQSNAVGRAVNEGGYAHPAETYQYDQVGSLVAATTPLDHVDPANGDVGFDVGFAAAWHAAAPAGSTLTFVPCAEGGTGFSDARWRVGDDLYQAAVARADAGVAAVRAARGTARLGGFLWLQGETDRAMTQGAYEDALLAMIAGLRADSAEADAATPFVLGQMTPETVAGSAGGAAIDGVHRAVPDLIGHAALASNDGTAGMVGEDIHYDDASQALVGQRMQAGIATAIGNAPAVPDQVTGLVASAGGDGAVDLAFDAPSANRSPVTDYDVRVDGSLVADGTSTATTRTIGGLAAGQSYAFEVRAVNAVGAGPWSAVANAAAGSGSGGHPYPGALGFWQLGADNAGREEFGGGRALALKADAPTTAAAHVVLAASNANGLLSDVSEPTAYTAWAVLRPVTTGASQIAFGTLGPSSQAGGGAFFSNNAVNVHFRGNPANNVATGASVGISDFVFIAVSLAADGSYLYYVGDAGGAVTKSGTGTRTAPSHGKTLALGNAYYGSNFAASAHAAEFGVLSGPRDLAALDALYAEAKSRQAGRGNTVR